MNLDETEIPVLAGSEFAAVLDVDDTLETHISGYRTRFRVVGILKEGTSVLTDQIFSTGEEGGLVQTLDNAFLVPYLEIRGTPRTEEEAVFIQCNYEGNMQDGMIVVDADTPRSEVSGIEKKLCEIFTKYGLYPVTTVGGTYGMDIFNDRVQEYHADPSRSRYSDGCAQYLRHLHECDRQAEPEHAPVRD